MSDPFADLAGLQASSSYETAATERQRPPFSPPAQQYPTSPNFIPPPVFNNGMGMPQPPSAYVPNKVQMNPQPQWQNSQAQQYTGQDQNPFGGFDMFNAAPPTASQVRSPEITAFDPNTQGGCQTFGASCTVSSPGAQFDPFSPTNGTGQMHSVPSDSGGSSALQDRLAKKASKSQMLSPFDDFIPGGASSAPIQTTEHESEESSDDDKSEFDGSNFENPDEEGSLSSQQRRWSSLGSPKGDTRLHTVDPSKEEYEIVFEQGQKLGVLMERVDNWREGDEHRKEVAVVKLVVENGAADHAGVTTGSILVGINGRSMRNERYADALDLIKTAPRPLILRLKRVPEQVETSQGHCLARVSAGTFSIGNLTSGNARWTPKYFAFGGSRMDVLQLFVSRAAYHECVIALYEKRTIHTQIQSFRLCRDHKVTSIKSKIYKGYGNLHYFSLNVPSLHFVAAKFASDDYETIKNLWSRVYDAIEKQKQMRR